MVTIFPQVGKISGLAMEKATKISTRVPAASICCIRLRSEGPPRWTSRSWSAAGAVVVVLIVHLLCDRSGRDRRRRGETGTGRWGLSPPQRWPAACSIADLGDRERVVQG